ncbi:MAG TPA: PAS domain S-box protein, partial [Burkholderiaceae bacterium]|nr:PAS domain S-box protein [Burkholderiaceae bacterium]
LATDALGLGVFELVEGVPVWENDCMYRIFGRDKALGPIGPEEFVNSVLHPDDAEPLNLAFERAFAERRSLTVPCRIRRQDDGAWRWIEFTAYSETMPSGVVRLVGVVADITERHEATQRLRESEERARSLFEAMPVGVFILARDGRIHRFNDVAHQMLGYTRDEFAGLRLHNLIDHPAAAQLLQRIETVIEQPGTHTFESRYRHRDGRLIDFLVSAQRVCMDGVAYAMGIAMDVSAQKETERALQWQRTRLDVALEAGRMGAWQWDVSSATAIWSDGLYALVGLPKGSGIEPIECFLALVHEDDRELVTRNMSGIIEHGLFPEIEHRIRRPDGVVRWIVAKGRALRDESGRVTTIVGVNADITERKLLELNLREADRRKDEFLAMLSHELRNPLAPITTSIALLRRGIDGERASRLYDIIDRQTQQLTHLVNDLLEASRLTTGRIVIRPTLLWIDDAVQSALDTLQPQLTEREQQVRIVRQGQARPIKADPTRIAQIIVNLLHNAVKFSDPGATIELCVNDEPDAVTIRVADEGCGIEPHVLPHVFNLFEQGERTVERSNGGLGIGLALVKGLVELHGGAIAAESDGPGCGAVFTVRLPRDDTRESIAA